jgi:hypothetical protein
MRCWIRERLKLKEDWIERRVKIMWNEKRMCAVWNTYIVNIFIKRNSSLDHEIENEARIYDTSFTNIRKVSLIDAYKLLKWEDCWDETNSNCAIIERIYCRLIKRTLEMRRLLRWNELKLCSDRESLLSIDKTNSWHEKIEIEIERRLNRKAN